MSEAAATDWRHRAFCRGANSEIFDDPWHTETAKEYCRRCLVTDKCLAFALTLENDLDGTWGGTSKSDRVALKRGGYRVSCPGCLGGSIYNDGSAAICVGCGLTWRT